MNRKKVAIIIACTLMLFIIGFIAWRYLPFNSAAIFNMKLPDEDMFNLTMEGIKSEYYVGEELVVDATFTADAKLLCICCPVFLRSIFFVLSFGNPISITECFPTTSAWKLTSSSLRPRQNSITRSTATTFISKKTRNSFSTCRLMPFARMRKAVPSKSL